ncbi:MAG: efflux RND transporter permease subunit, partial [Leptospirales bacterium]|nr:efflux RND transporter permease subunit [Leptospirales bacterium]
VNVTMKDPKKRGVFAPFKKRPTQQEFMPFIRNELKQIPGVSKVTVMDLSLTGFSSRRGYPIEFTVQGHNWDELAVYSKQLMEAMESSKLMSDIDTDYKPGMPEIRVNPDRTKAGTLGVTVANIADTISATVSSLRVGKYTDEVGKRSDIRVSLMDKYSKTEEDIKKIKLRNNYGELVSLSDVVTTDVGPSMFAITRYNRERAIYVFANVAQGKSQAEALAYVKSSAAKILPEGYHIALTGSSQTFSDSFNSLYIALILGIIVAYMVLATQFNSFLHPVIILLALPFSVTGAIFAMKLTGISMNIYSMIGILLLMGIVKKNSILLVEFTNNMRKNENLNVTDALLQACPIRLRPILMTSIATIAAAVPPALALGAGAETVRPMAIVVIGGVFLSTILTLIIVPCAYSLMSRFESVKHTQELEEAWALLGEK